MPEDSLGAHSVLLRGFSWETQREAVRRTAEKQSSSSPAGLRPLECHMLVDSVARPSGSAILNYESAAAAATAAARLDGVHIEGDSRYAEARQVEPAERDELLCSSADALRRAGRLDGQSFVLARADRPMPPGGRRDFVLLCQEAPESVARGKFELNDLPAGRVVSNLSNQQMNIYIYIYISTIEF